MTKVHERIAEVLAAVDKRSHDHLSIASDISIDRIETPSIGLTTALNGGWGTGRQVLVWGPKSAGKSTFCMAQIGIAQRQGKTCAYFDVEKTFDPVWAEAQGVDTEALIYSSTGTITALVNDATQLMKAGIDIIVVDSITALMPASYVDEDGELKDFEKTGAIGGLSRGLSAALSQLNYANRNTLLILVSQTRMAQKGSMYWGMAPTGGESVKFYSSQVVKLYSSEGGANIIEGEFLIGDKIIKKPIGRKVTYSVDWNKLGPQGAQGEYNLYFAGDHVGIDNYGEILGIGVQKGVVRKAGAWYYYGEEKVGQGEIKAAAHLRENPTMFAAIKKDIYEGE
jgi:recombination protein RecA